MENKRFSHSDFLQRFKKLVRIKLKIDPKKEWGLQKRIAETLKVKDSIIQSWFSRSFPSPESLLKIYESLNISPNELLGIQEIKPKEFIARIEIRKEKEKRMLEETEGNNYIENFVLIPIAGKISAGTPREVEEDPDGVAVIYKGWAMNKENFTAVKVRGDSMAPMIPDGSLVGIDHSQRDPRVLNGKVVALRKGNEATIKRLRVIDNEMLIGEPDNKEWSKEIVVLRGKEMNDAIIGKVVWWWGRQA